MCDTPIARITVFGVNVIVFVQVAILEKVGMRPGDFVLEFGLLLLVK